MAKKIIYKVIPEFKGLTVYTSKPLKRDSGAFELDKCTQNELKYLYDVVGHKSVIAEEYETKEQAKK